MSRSPGAAAMSAMVVILSGAANPEATQTRESRLPGLIERLALTPAGAPSWLEKLGVRQGSLVQSERLLIVSLIGETVLEVEGQERRVSPTNEMNGRLDGDGPDVVLVHNHPAGTGLSADDLMQLTRPRVAAVAALGHDGSVYVAAAGPRHAGPAFARDQYRPLCAEVERRLSVYLSGPMAASRRASVAALLPHLVGLALQRALAIEYSAVLSPANRAKYAPLSADSDRAIAAAIQEVIGDARAHSGRVSESCGR